MQFQPPTTSDLAKLADKFGLTVPPDDLAVYLGVLGGTVEAYARLSSEKPATPEERWSHRSFCKPEASHNYDNGWYVRTSLKESDTGSLKGKTLAIKDSICVGGLPVMNGASMLDGYIAEMDATVVTRILGAGGTITGKSNCEYLCASGGSHTGSNGPVRNPHASSRSAGGSSSGSAALVARGAVDMALGTDQGGSIRMPASFCGIYGMKPTYGLVPFTGIAPVDAVVDHVGPMTSTVRDNALLLEVIAGDDGLDPRQRGATVNAFSDAVGKSIRGLRIGVVQEGFDLPGGEPDVDEAVRAAANKLSKQGAIVAELSAPFHLAALQIFLILANDGMFNTLMAGDGFGLSRRDAYLPQLIKKQRKWRESIDTLAPTVKMSLLMGAYIREKHGPYFYAGAMNEAYTIKRHYDDLFEDFDLLLMPTTAMKATPLPGPDAPLSEYLQRALEPLMNTAQFNLTGHPAMAVPCAMREGLPVSMMLVGPDHREDLIYSAAYAFEQSADWKNL